MLITAILFEDDRGARVRISVPKGIPVQEGQILKSLSLGAIRGTDLINSMNHAFKKLQQIKSEGHDLAVEQDFIAPKTVVPSPESQVAGMMQNAAEVPPVFVAQGEGSQFCTCTLPIGEGKRCMNCGKLQEPPKKKEAVQ